MEKHLIESAGYLPTAEERAQLVQFCATISGDRDVAEDLAYVGSATIK